MPEKITSLLVVDDEADIGAHLSSFLSPRQFEVVTAHSAEEALRLLENKSFDIALLDIVMHGIDGGTVARIINEKYPHTKIIIVTAHPDEGFRVSSQSIVECVLIKPLGIEDLYNKLLLLT
jgi:DNA-binding response OmpR family regulator